jgi:hypothetical protein
MNQTKQISERAFVFASRMKARNEPESTIRKVLSEFELSDAEIGFVLQEAAQLTPFRVSASLETQKPKQVIKLLLRAKKSLRNFISIIA